MLQTTSRWHPVRKVRRSQHTCVPWPLAGIFAALMACGDSAGVADAAVGDTAPDGGAAHRDAGANTDGGEVSDGARPVLPQVDPAPGACAQDEPDATLPGDAAMCNATNWFSHLYDLRGCDLSGIDAYQLLAVNNPLRGARTFDLVGCSIDENASSMTDYRCMPQGDSGRFALIGPGVDLSGADLTDMHLSAVVLTGVRAHDLLACPASTAPDMHCVETVGGRFALVGPELELAGADLRKADLRGVSLTRAHTASLDACPEQLPSEAFTCLPTSPCGFALVGPGVDLSETDLSGVDLSEQDLRGVDFSRGSLVGADLRDASLEDAVLNADLRDVELEGALLEGAATLPIWGCPKSLPSEAFRCLALGTPAVSPADFDTFDPALCETPMDQPQWSCTWALVGPGVVLKDGALSGADLRGLDLEGADLGGTSMEAAKAYGLLTCPATLAPEWRCLGPLDDGRFAIVGQGIDLRGADLSGADLEASDLLRARATELSACPASSPPGFVCALQESKTHALVGPMVDAHGASLARAQLTGAELWQANLEGADLEGAVLDGVNLGAASLAGTKLKGASLVGANLGESTHDNIEGQGADLTAADLTDADLRGADLRHAVLTGAALTGAALDGAATSGLIAISSADDGCPASLPSSDWRCVAQPFTSGRALVGPGADLRKANFEQADLDGANMTDVNLDGAVLRSADLSGVTWSNTTCPDGTNSGDHAQTCEGFL